MIGNASGIVTAIKAAQKDRMDLALNVGIGSSVQQILISGVAGVVSCVARLALEGFKEDTKNEPGQIHVEKYWQ